MELFEQDNNNEISNAENNTTYLKKSTHYKIFFTLKDQSVVQQNLIAAIMKRYNCSIDDLACMLHVDAKKLSRVGQGKAKLTEKKSQELVRLFYILFH